jgi:DNA adenine methylase
MNIKPHLVQYQGSKRSLAPEILKYMPNKFNRLIEPFAGTAAIALACASRSLCTRFIINDLNRPLIELLEIVVNDPQYASSKYEEIWKEQKNDSVEHYYQIREIFNLTKDPIMFLYLLARCVKGAVRYNSDGMFNQSPDKRRHGTNPTTMRFNIFSISKLLGNRTEFLSLDYSSILALSQPGDIVYMDPPYQGVCGDRDSRYFSGINHDDFVQELHKLSQKGISYIVSYDGKYGNQSYGKNLPKQLGLQHIQINAGRSTQATLLGKNIVTIESLYITRDLAHNYRKTLYRGNNAEIFQAIP